MRYYLLVNRRPEGPFEVPDLLAQPDFGGASMVCFVGATSADAWRRAERVPELAQALAERAPAAEASADAETAVVDASPDADPIDAAPADEAVATEEGAESTVAEGEVQQWNEPEAGAQDASADPTAESAAEEAPAVEGAPVDPDGPQGDDNPGHRLIMIVEDDAEFRGLLSSAVRMEGFRVVSAEDGRDASGKLDRMIPDLIVTDLMMPRQGGYEFVRALQAAGHGDIPVIVVTGITLDPTAVSSMRMESNIVEFFTKPLNMSGLLSLIHDKLGTKRLSPRQKLEKERDDGWSSGV